MKSMRDMYGLDYTPFSNSTLTSRGDVSPAVMRLISLAMAETGVKVSLAANVSQTGSASVFAQKIVSDKTDNDKWQLQPVNAGKDGLVFLRHLDSGLYLAANFNQTGLTLLPFASIRPENGVWSMRGDQRGITLANRSAVSLNASAKHCVSSSNTLTGHTCSSDSDCESGESCKNLMDVCIGTVAKAKKPQLRKGAADITNSCGFCGYPGSAFGGNPVVGNVYLKISNSLNSDGAYSVSLASPTPGEQLTNMVCTGVVQSGDKSLDWYLLEQKHPSNKKFGVGVCSPMSVGELYSWSPETDVNAQLNATFSNVAKRFVDTTTQTVPEQSQFPQTFIITQDPGAVGVSARQSAASPLQRVMHWNWQYTDIYARFAGNQGHAPTELLNITPEFMGVGGEESQLGPGPSPDNGGPAHSNRSSMWHYIDGNMSAGMGGRIALPPKWMVDAAHKNGAACHGTIFFQEVYYGGKWSWWTQFLQDPILTATKLVQLVQFYGFDGFLFNLESGPPDNTLPASYGGQAYKGINELTGENADNYWCNVMAGATYPAWWSNQGLATEMNPTCGMEANWPCSCGNTITTPDGQVEVCGSKGNQFTTACVNGWTARNNFKIVVKTFRKLADAQGLTGAKLVLYDTIQVTSPYGVGISAVPSTCTKGVTNTGACFGNSDFWQDSEGKVADAMFSMRSGFGGSEPSASPAGTTSTYIMSQPAAQATPRSGIRLDWTKNTGPTAEGTFCNQDFDNSLAGVTCTADSDCGNGGQCAALDWLAVGSSGNTGNCIPKKIYSGFMCNNGLPGGLPGIDAASTRAYDYFQTIQTEGLGGGHYSIQSVANALKSMTASGAPQGWDSAIYCGTQSKNLGNMYPQASGNCTNEETATERPLASLSVYIIDKIWKMADDISLIPGWPDVQALTDYMMQAQLVWWTGARNLDPYNRVLTGTCATYWKGISHYVPERSVLSSAALPFSTDFSLGYGYDVWIQGYPQMYGEWNDWSQQGVLPTWMWWAVKDGYDRNAQHLKASFDVTDAFQGGNCLKFSYVEDESVWLQASPDSLYYKYPKSNPDGPTRARFNLYKTKFPLVSGITVAVRYKLNGTTSRASIGVQLSNGKTVIKQLLVNNENTESSGWSTDTLVLEALGSFDFAVMIFVKVEVSSITSADCVKLGELRVFSNDSSIPLISTSALRPTVETSHTTSATKETRVVLNWGTVSGVQSFAVFLKNKLVGRVYQGQKLRKTAPEKVSFTTVLKSSDSVSDLYVLPMVSGREQLQRFASLHPRAPPTVAQSAAYYTSISAVAVLGSLGIGLGWKKMQTKGLKAGMIILLIVVLAAIAVPYMLVTSKKVAKPGMPVQRPVLSVATWSKCKAHTFNACFDDAHVKGWRWLTQVAADRKWPVRFTFFYNTLWINRDYDILKQWIAQGHEIASHLHDHVCACDTSISDADMVANVTECANYIRQLYNDSSRELMMAWPHGAYAVTSATQTCTGQDCGPFNGAIREKVMTALEKTYIAGRGTQVSPSLTTWPMPSSTVLPYEFPAKWSWPYQLDANPDASTTGDIAAITKTYMSSLHSALSVPGTMFVLAGHIFSPTDAQGIDVPCDSDAAQNMTDGPYAGGSWCTDSSDCANTYQCPSEVSSITLGCYDNSGPPVPLGDVAGLSDLSIMKKFPMVPPTLPPPGGSGHIDCNQCADACWNPSPGSSLLAVFDYVSKPAVAETLWFATFTEIVQYTQNRDNTTITILESEADTFILETIKPLKYPLTLSLGSVKPTRVLIDGKVVSVNTSYDGQVFVDLQPVEGVKHKIRVEL